MSLRLLMIQAREPSLRRGLDSRPDSGNPSTYHMHAREVEREFIYKRIGEMELWKQLIPLMEDKKLNKQLGLLRSHRVQGGDLDNDKIKLKTQKLPIFTKIDKIIKDAQIIAEADFLRNRKDIQNTIEAQKAVDANMGRGNVQEASDLQKKELETRKLLQMAK